MKPKTIQLKELKRRSGNRLEQHLGQLIVLHLKVLIKF